jgi:hypothetical protein
MIFQWYNWVSLVKHVIKLSWSTRKKSGNILYSGYMMLWTIMQQVKLFYFYGLFMVREFTTWGNINLEWFIVLNILLGKGIKFCWIKSILFSLVVPFYKSVIEKQKQTSNKAEQDTARDASDFMPGEVVEDPTHGTNVCTFC